MPAPSQQQYGNDSRVDVLIIGAGPAGLFCANGLARNGVRVRIVDKKPTKVMVGQADGIQPRTIEVLQVRDGHNIGTYNYTNVQLVQSYGLAERLLKEANQVHLAAFYHAGSNGIEVRPCGIDEW
jgi:phenol 2-monooxygenase